MFLNNLVKTKIIDTLLNLSANIEAIYLFGSQNNGTARSNSDVDIATMLPFLKC